MKHLHQDCAGVARVLGQMLHLYNLLWVTDVVNRPIDV